MEKIIYTVRAILSIVLISISLTTFWIFRPVTYLDNFNSYLICNNGTYYQAGSNFVFSITGKLDQFNDKKARKLCDHGIILDYGDTYTTNPSVNYRYKPATKQDSDWLQALLVASVPLTLAYFLTKKIKFKTAILILIPVTALIVFLLFLKPSATNLFCQRKAALQSEDFKKSANKAGRLLHELDEKYSLKINKKIYENCLSI